MEITGSSVIQQIVLDRIGSDVIIKKNASAVNRIVKQIVLYGNLHIPVSSAYICPAINKNLDLNVYRRRVIVNVVVAEHKTFEIICRSMLRIWIYEILCRTFDVDGARLEQNISNGISRSSRTIQLRHRGAKVKTAG